MRDNNRIKYSEPPTTPLDNDDSTVYYRESRSIYSEDGEKFVKMSPYGGLDFGFDKITEITLRNGTKYICDEAFDGCDNIKSINIPPTVTHIGNNAFLRCRSLESITIPNSVKFIGYQAFAGCSSLTSIYISNGLESIGFGAFYGCTSLKNIVLPDTVRCIGDSTFEGCSGLKGVVLSSHLDSIGPMTFKDCSSLISVSIPDSVLSIGEQAFYNCSELESITLPQGLKIIESNLFNGCKALRNIELPESVQIIKSMSFWGCEKLQSISFPSTLESIAEVAFNYCRSLEKVDLSNCLSLKTIERSTFYACSGIKSILFPTSISSIEKEAFSYCSSLETLCIPKSVRRIEYKAFQDCGIKSVYFQSADIQIDHYAFNFCRKFEKVFIPSGTFGYFYPLLKSLTTINFNGHMTFVEVGDSISDIKGETKRILSDTFIHKPLYRLGNCHPDYCSTSERSYFVSTNGKSKRIDIKVMDISCYSSCTGCLRIGKDIVYNWPGDNCLLDDSSKSSYPKRISELLKEANGIEDKNKRYELLLLALQLTLQEIDSRGIVISEALRQVVGFELSDSVRKHWSYTSYDTGRDPSQPSSMEPPLGGSLGTTIMLLTALIYILGERFNTASSEA